HKGPAAVRYPRGAGPGVLVESQMTGIPVGKGEVQFKGSGIAILAFGSMVHTCIDIATNLDATLVNMRFIKPLDLELIRQISESHEILITVEENAISGGAGSGVNELLAAEGIVLPILNIGIPDHFIEHGSREDCLSAANLDEEGVLKQIMARLRLLGMARQSGDLPVMKSG
ncbi:MAG: 1-deoxy-D-xylulose-5-phosphate synthase, partial [Lysobacterales bacterium]